MNAYNHELPSSISFRDAFPKFGVGVLWPPDKFKGVGFLHAAGVLVHIDLFGNHDLPSPILAWICSFLTGRTQQVKHLGKVSSPRPINRSIVQGSGLGPTLYIVMESDLRAVSGMNLIFKSADDTNLIVPENSDVVC